MWRGETKAGKISMGGQDFGKNIAKKNCSYGTAPGKFLHWLIWVRVCAKKNPKNTSLRRTRGAHQTSSETFTNPTLNTICKNLTSAKLVCAMMKISLPSMAHVTHAFLTSWIERTVRIYPFRNKLKTDYDQPFEKLQEPVVFSRNYPQKKNSNRPRLPHLFAPRMATACWKPLEKNKAFFPLCLIHCPWSIYFEE